MILVQAASERSCILSQRVSSYHRGNVHGLLFTGIPTHCCLGNIYSPIAIVLYICHLTHQQTKSNNCKR